MTAFDRLLIALETTGARTTGNGRTRMAQCPAHDDGHASLSVTQGNDRVLVKCQAGCDTDDVLAALALTSADLFNAPKSNGNSRGEIVATYDYLDEAETLLFQVVRFEPKGFRQRKPDGNGGWIWKLGDTPKVLYRLPQVLAAAKAHQTVYVVEGEKDVHAIEKAGAVATTCPGGAGKWQPHHTAALTGADVVVIPDRDTPGRTHGHQVVTALRRAGITTRTFEPATGKDVADHLTAGLGLEDLAPITTNPNTPDEGTRHIVLTKASQIKPRPVFWLWKRRLALGTLGLLAGREGTGKSTLGYWVAARLTRGELYGIYYGTPKAVLVCATEDSWEHTIVPRLIAADANLDLVERVEVLNAIDLHVSLSLPRDLLAVEKAATDTDAALLILDPLMSRLDDDLDTHRDGEVRKALEPLVAIADRTRMAVLGLIHHNKSGSSDPLQLVMASKAFTAVARSVHTVMPDPDDDTGQRRLFGTPKNNLGRTDLPMFSFTITGHPIPTEEGTAWTGKLEWGDEQTTTIEDAMRRAGDNGDDRSAVTEAMDWLSDYVSSKGGQVPSADAKKAGARAGHNVRSLQRARDRLKLTVSNGGFPRATYWEIPVGTTEAGTTVVPTVVPTLRGEGTTDMTGLFEAPLSTDTPVVPVVPVVTHPTRAGTTGGTTEPTPLCALCHTQPAPPGRGICQPCAAQAAS